MLYTKGSMPQLEIANYVLEWSNREAMAAFPTAVIQHFTNVLKSLVGSIVTLRRGVSTHVGVLRPITDSGDKWVVSYYIEHYAEPLNISFDVAQVYNIVWDMEYDRPLLILQRMALKLTGCGMVWVPFDNCRGLH